MQEKLANLIKQILAGGDIPAEEYAVLINPQIDTYELLYGANLLREHYKGKKIDFCSIINARSGECSEDCVFCAQSAHHNAKINVYPLVSREEMERACLEAGNAGAQRLGIVTSGGTLDMDEIGVVAEAAESMREKGGIPVCASLGSLDREKLQRLKAAGIDRIHCNLETSERFFPKVCTTHSWQSKLETVNAAKEEGFEVCGGGIFGLGETWEDRLDLALTLKGLNVDSVPLNFLVRVPGTPSAEAAPLEPLEILRIIAIYRYVLPEKDVRVCGGREANLRSLQSWIFYAGANGAMLGNYLTTTGNPPEDDLQMVRDLGLKTRPEVEGERIAPGELRGREKTGE